MNKNKGLLRKSIALLALLCAFSSCRSTGEENVTTAESTAPGTEVAESASTEATTITDEDYDPFLDENYTQPTLYTGKAVEKEEDHSIYKFNYTAPEGYELFEYGPSGIYLANENSSIIVKSQNYKEEFTELSKFAESAMANIIYGNMLYQSDTNYSEQIKTTVAGFDAIRYNYNITTYIFTFETDAEGSVVTEENGKKKTTSKDVYSELSDRIYVFYSDEDMFYIICETPKDCAEELAPVFDAFIDSIWITAPGEAPSHTPAENRSAMAEEESRRLEAAQSASLTAAEGETAETTAAP